MFCFLQHHVFCWSFSWSSHCNSSFLLSRLLSTVMIVIILILCSGNMLTVRECTMMRMMDQLTDKKDWSVKIFNDEIAVKWRQEFLASDSDISEKMVDEV